ncbi:unnamed protein product [Peronospora belbahrii]|uniref:NudC domain-containing protein 1 n=1 Tax=Peronospora belbahrii TaxID=622444 RepID=A0ABN8CYX0_9STRA|nr:unnamed protein product [Peronospora belbahrii]
MSVMEVNRTLVDKNFDCYELATDGIRRYATVLSIEALKPLGVSENMRKAHWESRVHYNALTADPFLSQSEDTSVAYYVNAEYQLVQVMSCKRAAEVKCENVYNLPVLTTRQENVSVLVADKGLVVYCDGQGTLYFLKAEADPKEGDKWSVVYKCSPWGVTPLLLLGASYDEQYQHIHVVVAEPLLEKETDGAFRLSLIRVKLKGSITASDVETESRDAGLEHVTLRIAIVTKLPAYVSFNGPEMVLLVDGTYQLLLEFAADKKEQTTMEKDTQGIATLMPHKRRHDEDELDDNEMAAFVSMLPRVGIGFHGKILKPKEPSELASLDSTTPLSERFHKSSTPFSSVDISFHDAPDVSTRYRKENIGSSERRSLEIPTAESVLNGIEECDGSDPNAKASLLLVNCTRQTVQQQVDIDCRNFQFLCPSARARGPNDLKSTLLFRNDVHGLVFELSSVCSRLKLQHTATLPAFGFVQASKQEQKFLSFHPSGSFACIGEFERRVFVYRGSNIKSDCNLHTRKQHVVEFGDQELVGMQLVNDSTILVLTSSHIYTLLLDA